MNKLFLYIGVGILIMGILGSVTIAYNVLHQGEKVSHQVSHVSQPVFPSIGTPIQVLNSSTGVFSGSNLGWSQDGSQLYGVKQNGEVRIWNTTTWSNVLTYGIPYGYLTADSFSPNRNYFATLSLADPTLGTVRVWNTITGNEVQIHQSHSKGVLNIAWSPDGTQIASDDGNSVEVWNATTGNTDITLHTDSGVLAIVWSPDGTRIAVASETSIQIWDVATGNSLLTFRGPAGGVQSAAWSPDGRYIALSDINGPDVQIWDATNGNLVLTYKGHTDTVWAITWSPDSKRIVTGGLDKTVQIWDPATGNNIFTYHGHSEGVSDLAWSPNGRFIASSGGDGTVQIWWAI